MNIRRIADLVWPTPEKESELNPSVVFDRYGEVVSRLQDKNTAALTSRLYEASKYIYEQEEQRRLKLEQKATNSLNAVVIASALVIGLAPLLLEDKLNADKPLTVLMISCYVLSSIYLARAGITALSAHGKVIRYCLGPDDIAPAADATEESYMKQLCLRLIGYTIENYKINNRQFAIVHTSQRCFRNAIILLGIFGVLLTIETVSISHQKTEPNTSSRQIFNLINKMADPTIHLGTN